MGFPYNYKGYIRRIMVKKRSGRGLSRREGGGAEEGGVKGGIKLVEDRKVGGKGGGR